MLLRRYLNKYGTPEPQLDDSIHVLRELSQYLYRGGAPLWALEPVMKQVAQGLTGDNAVEWLLLPRKAAVFCCGTTSLFGIVRGFDISLLDATEKITSRVASFASNGRGVSNIPETFPNPTELNLITPSGTILMSSPSVQNSSIQQGAEEQSAIELRTRILNLCSSSEGLFYFINSRRYLQSASDASVDDFWIVTDEEREVFQRLACTEAQEMIRDVANGIRELYPRWILLLSRFVSASGAAAIWFNGYWYDIIVAGLLAAVIAKIAQSSFLSKQEKIVYEVIASVVVGLISASITLTWPQDTCFEAMATAAVIDILQGFRIVYAIIEVMSKHTVPGGADLIEGIVFTGLIAMSLRFGQQAAIKIFGPAEDGHVYGNCRGGIDELWYILFVPVSSVAWAIMFNPNYRDLLPMSIHGCLAFSISYGLSLTGATNNMNLFIAASAVSFSAGIYSRFNGRQSVGNTVTGIYVLVPGAYLARRFFEGTGPTAYMDVSLRGIIIGLGCWTGYIFCSPTVLGSTMTLLFQSQQNAPFSRSNRFSSLVHRQKPQDQPFTMLSF